MNTHRSVLILGSRGRLGAALVDTFATAGWTVHAQMRRPLDTPPAANVRPVLIPMMEPARIAAAATGARIVVHALNPAYTRWEQEAMPLMQQAIDTALRLNARLIFAGNVYEFGAALPEVLHERTPFAANTSKARIRIALDQALQDAKSRGLRSLVVRAGDFFGSGRGSWFDLGIVKDLARGSLLYPGPTDQAHAWAYVPDLAQAYERLARHEAALPDFARYHFAGHSLTGKTLLDTVEAAMKPHRDYRRKQLPWGLIGAVGRIYRPWAALHEMAYLWPRPHRLDGQALRDVIGNEPHTPLDQAIGDALQRLGFRVSVAAHAARAGGAA
jgi:nucleoside-diphosphate-sugar epimerase